MEEVTIPKRLNCDDDEFYVRLVLIEVLEKGSEQTHER